MKFLKLVFILGASLLIGCVSSKETNERGEVREPGAALDPHEADFSPADHDPSIQRLLGEERDSTRLQGDAGAGVLPLQTPEVVTGFRVQLYSSRDIEEARVKEAEAETTFPGEWIYLVYDSPTYKIRAGNFIARYDADRFLKQATERGYTDAWIVPEKVFRNPPPPPRPQASDGTNRK